MKKTLLLIIAVLFSLKPVYSQFEDRFNAISKQNIEGFAKPLATSAGMILNSAGFYSAELPSTFGFGFSIVGMYVMVPDDEKTFTPVLSGNYNTTTPTATIYGGRGSAYAGPNGYQVFPSGFDVQAFPAGMIQASLQFMKSELLIRYVPPIPVSKDKNVSLIGGGLKHEIDQYFLVLPINVAVQFMYNRFEITDLVTETAWAANLHVSKRFSVLGLFAGIQYESSSMDVNYTYKGDNNTQNVKVTANMVGNDNFRFICGLALHLGPLTLHADANFGAQTVLTTGLSF